MIRYLVNPGHQIFHDSVWHTAGAEVVMPNADKHVADGVLSPISGQKKAKPEPTKPEIQTKE